MTDLLAPFEDYLKSARIPIRLACVTDSGWPVVISLWFTYRDGLLYCATRSGARVVKYLEADPRCAFEIAADKPPYCGVRGQARARIDSEMGIDILEELIELYIGNEDNKLAENLLKYSDEEVAIVIEPVNAFEWDFSGRMKDSLDAMLERFQSECPQK